MIIQTPAEEESPRIELTPIIDMVFLLLIFFLVATTFQQTERELSIALPDSEAAGPITMQLREIVINVTNEGAIIVGGRTVGIEDLRAIVTDAVKANAEQKVSIRGDKDVPYGTVARVLDVCKAAGVDAPFLDTVPTN
ncbi:MAG: biopolymer transporter ExbD [Phycisphaerales bacterium]